MSYMKLKTNNNCLLSYAISTDPDPIQVSPKSGDPSGTSLEIAVSNNTSQCIYCKQLQFSFPIGDLAQDLASTDQGIGVSTSDKRWTISRTSSGVFTATPNSDDDTITTDGLIFQIYNIQVNKQVGTFTFSITENSSNENQNFHDRTKAYELAKFPYGFYVENFAVSSSIVQVNDTVKLTWSGSDNAIYKIRYKYGEKLVNVTDLRSWTSPPLTNITTFALEVTVEEKGESVETKLYVTVIVANPDITATKLDVVQNASDSALSVNQEGLGNAVNILATNTGNNNPALSVSQAGLSNAVEIQAKNPQNNEYPALYVSQAGLSNAVYIDATNPQNNEYSALYVSQAGLSNAVYIQATNTGNNDPALSVSQAGLSNAVQILATNTANNYPALAVSQAGLSNAVYIDATNTGNNYPALYVSQAGLGPAVYIDGKVGINTTTPNDQLTVQGGITADQLTVQGGITADQLTAQGGVTIALNSKGDFGYLNLLGPNGKNNISLGASPEAPNNGSLSVYAENGKVPITIYVDGTTGKGIVTADSFLVNGEDLYQLIKDLQAKIN